MEAMNLLAKNTPLMKSDLRQDQYLFVQSYIHWPQQTVLLEGVTTISSLPANLIYVYIYVHILCPFIIIDSECLPL
jgi:hypothetical protein